LKFGFGRLYVRGIGGQKYTWNSSGWYTAVGTNGKYLDRYLYDAQGKTLPSLPNPSNLYSFKNFSALGQQIMNPYFYSYKFLDPIYYPMEIPGTGRPVDPPRMEMGAPCEDEDDCCCGGGGISSNELVFLLRAMGRIPKHGPPDLSLLKFGNKLAHHQEQK
jgi:hypothetical protein